jgi:hypothetical protein
MVRIPDGLGAYDNGDATFTVLMNHELGATSGIARAHGSKGAFVSEWTIRKDDLSVVSGQDLISEVYLWQDGRYVAGTTAFDRFCSADLPAPTAFYNPASGNGYGGRIFTNGEGGAALQASSVTAGVSGFQRPKDGSWDPSDPRVFYFVTTASFESKSRLWRLTFADPPNPAAGGTIDLVLDGTEGQKMFDNITVNDRGQVLLQEDVGNNPRLGKVWLYDASSDTLTEIAHHDETRFLAGGSQFLTQDEESSGIIPAPFLGAGKYLLDVQAHFASPDPELVQGGQLLVLQVPPGKFGE